MPMRSNWSPSKTPAEAKNHNQLIRSFYEQLDDELHDFTLPIDELITTYDYIEYEFTDGNVVGIAGLRDVTFRNKHNLVLVVRKVYQNKGLGQILLKRVIQRARNNKYGYIQLTVFKENEAAVHLYEKYGFHHIASVKIGGRDSYYMILPLSLKGHAFVLVKRVQWLLRSRFGI